MTIDDFVDRDETILWRGKPDPRWEYEGNNKIRKGSLIVFLALLVVFLLLNTLQKKPLLDVPVAMLLFSVIFFAAWTWIGNRAWKSHHATPSAYDYAVTEKRVLASVTASGPSNFMPNGLTLEGIKSASIQPGKYGTSTVTFVPTHGFLHQPIIFKGITDAGTVRDLVLSRITPPTSQ